MVPVLPGFLPVVPGFLLVVPGLVPGLLPLKFFGTGYLLFLTGSGSGSTGSIGTIGPFPGSTGLAGFRS